VRFVAARRLIIVLLVLFGISVLAASIAPDRKGGQLLDSPDSTSSTTTAKVPPPPEATGEALTARITASATDPQTVEGFAGDQLELIVASDQSVVVELPDFGVTGTAAENAPATFDLLLRDSGRFAITDDTTEKILGRLIVREPKTQGRRAGKPNQSGE